MMEYLKTNDDCDEVTSSEEKTGRTLQQNLIDIIVVATAASINLIQGRPIPSAFCVALLVASIINPDLSGLPTIGKFNLEKAIRYLIDEPVTTVLVLTSGAYGFENLV